MKRIIAAILSAAIMISSLTVVASAAGRNELTDEWKEMVLENYNEFIAEVDGNSNRIPIIVHTDQHGAVKWNSEFYTYIDSIVDWTKVSKIINLGDTVSLIFNPFELINYRHAAKCLPVDKRIEVIGNHDRFFVPSGKLVNSLFFPMDGAEKSSDKKAFVVKDEQFNVRYLSVDPKVFPWNYENGSLKTAQADFIIQELSKDDASDIIMLSHPYIFKDAVIRRNGEVFTGSEFFIGGADKFVEERQSFIDMLSARKNKTSGVLLDCCGIEHPYDFSDCEGDFLMALHGHHHSEGYETKDGITQFLFQSMTKDNAKNTEPFCFYFAYIDTEAKTFKCWKNVIGYEAWEFSIA